MFKNLSNRPRKTEAEIEEARRAMLDRDWQGKSLKAVTVRLTGSIQFEPMGGSRIRAVTERGPMQLVLDGSRMGEAVDRLNLRLNAAFEAHYEIYGKWPAEDAPLMCVVVLGRWRKRAWTDAKGVRHDAWDLIAAHVSWKENGVEVEAGWAPLKQDAAQAA